MRRIAHLLSVLLFAGLFATIAQAQTLTGTIEGKVTDPQGGVLPGVTLTLTGPRGTQTGVTDDQGVYRFVGVAPDIYKLKAELPGFDASEVEATIGIGQTITSDFSLKLAARSEVVEVLARASTVDVKGAATNTNLTNELLTKMPIYSSNSIDLLNNAPGINSSSAYGAQAGLGNALLLDGVDTRDPAAGFAWTFFNQNLIQEIQIGGLGTPAEYGGFTGAIINTITKSGGNAYSGLFSIRYTGDSLASGNLDDSILQANPTLGQAAITTKLTDYTVQMGGPVKKDKAFFFVNVQRYSDEQDPTGPVSRSTDISPRFNIKFTLQPSPTDTIVAGMQYDSFNVTGRPSVVWPASQVTDRQTVTEDSPDWVWNFQWRKIFGASTFLEAKFTGYNAYFNLDPVDPAPYTFDGFTGEYCCGGGGNLNYQDRKRNQLQVSLTKYADKFGKHSLKFGAEIERSHTRDIGQPYGPAGFYIFAYDGIPYYQYSYGYDVQGDNRRTSLYAQDQWNAGKVTLNIGLRLDHIRGRSPELDQDVYKPKAAWGPRIGVSYDLAGKGTTALKAYYGRYFEGTASAFYISAVPGIQDLTQTLILPNGQLGTSTVLIPGSAYEVSSDITHPRTDEFNLSFETQLTQALRFTATGIWRDTGNFINNVIEGSRWRPVTLTNQLTGQPFTGYNWANSATTNDNFLITNPEGFQYIATDGTLIATADPKRTYRGLLLVLNSSLRNRLGYQVSYVLAKAEGTVDNSGSAAWLGGTQWNSPNTAVINADGELTNSRRHEFKAYVSYDLPRVDVMLSGIYTGRSGRPYTPFGQFSSRELPNLTTGRRQILLAPRGSERNDFFNNFDLRAEKAFRYAGHRFGVYTDIQNLFNTATVTSRQTRVPSTTISGKIVLYQAPTAVQTARQVSFGGRWSF
jgi:Carboxypeptidase regulatory-like domain